ncbi:MAG: DUF29 domain-containing protein [Candidatus Binataceae bacterium]|nr:DUF29 domain-containing protein [Candidatus Binataceae bacterium]
MAKALKISSAALPPADLYDQDYYTWTQAQARALRDHRLDEVDWANVAEEIEDLGKSERRALRSRLVTLLEHLLKFAHARERMFENNARGWELSARNAREAFRERLEENPGLRPQLEGLFISAYRSARIETMKALRLPDAAIPEMPPWTIDEIIDDAFLPPRKS